MSASSNDSRESIGRYVKIFERGRTYHADINFNGVRRRQSLGTRNVKEARALALDLDAKLRREGLCDRPQRVELDEAVEMYLAHVSGKGRRPSTLERYRALLEVFLAFARTKRVRFLNQVSLLLVEEYQAIGKEAGYTDKTLENRAIVVKQLVKWAVERSFLAQDPLRGLKVSGAKARPQPCFDLAQVDMILKAAQEPCRSIFEVLAFTGMRIGEAIWLTWDDVDFERGFIHVRPKGDWVPKHGRSRVIPIHERARAVLEKLPRKHRWVFPYEGSCGPAQDDHQWSEQNLLHKLKKVLARVGSKGKLHTFRHFFISYCANRGIPPFTLIKWVGHADVRTVMGYYSLTDDESLWRMHQLSVQDEAGRSPERRAEAM